MSVRGFMGIVVTTTCLFVVLCPAASATPILIASAAAPNDDHTTTSTSATDAVQAINTFAEVVTCCSGALSGVSISSVAKARADFGSIGAYTSIVNGRIARASADWQDDFLITGAPNGTLLDFDVAYNVNGDLSQSNAQSQFSSIRSWITGLPNPGPCINVGLCNADVVAILDNTETETVQGSFSQVLHLQLVAGQTYTVTQSLRAFSSFNGILGAAPFDPAKIIAGQSTSADFFNTASFSLTPITDGAGYTTASGHRYDALAEDPSLTPVPEPATMTMLGLGLGGMALRRFRRRP